MIIVLYFIIITILRFITAVKNEHIKKQITAGARQIKIDNIFSFLEVWQQPLQSLDLVWEPLVLPF